MERERTHHSPQPRAWLPVVVSSARIFSAHLSSSRGLSLLQEPQSGPVRTRSVVIIGDFHYILVLIYIYLYQPLDFNLAKTSLLLEDLFGHIQFLYRLETLQSTTYIPILLKTNNNKQI